MEYKVGDVIAQQSFGGGVRYVLVETKEEDVKNGRPGFDGILVTSDGTPIEGEFTGVWGYDSQIMDVIVNV